MSETFKPWDAAEILAGDPELMALYLDEAAATGEASMIARALGAIARARNFSGLAREIGLSRAGLDKALSGDGNPTLETILKVTKALGVKLHFGQTLAQTHMRKRPTPRRASAGKPNAADETIGKRAG